MTENVYFAPPRSGLPFVGDAKIYWKEEIQWVRISIDWSWLCDFHISVRVRRCYHCAISVSSGLCVGFRRGSRGAGFYGLQRFVWHGEHDQSDEQDRTYRN